MSPPPPQSLNPRVAQKKSSIMKQKQEQEQEPKELSLANDFSDDEFESSGAGLGGGGGNNDDGDGMSSSAASSYTEGGTPKKYSAVVKRVRNVMGDKVKRLGHLELFGVTWFDFAAISCARWIFIFALLGAAAGLATAVYLKLQNEEIANFDEEFEDMAMEMIELANAQALSVFKIMAGVTTTMTSSIGQKAYNSLYPRSFHTMPDMEQHFGTARNASGALVLAYAPIVLSNQLGDWAEYSEANQGWIQAINEQEYLSHNTTLAMSDVQPILPYIWDYAPDDEIHAYLKECKSSDHGDDHGDDHAPHRHRHRGRQRRGLEQQAPEAEVRIPLLPRDGPFAPLWTYSPGPPAQDTTNINMDLFAKPRLEEAINSINLARRAMFLDVCNLAALFLVDHSHHPDDKDEQDEDVHELLEAVVAHPVFASFDDNAPIVGNMIEIFPWRSFFENILSDRKKPVHVVLANSCGQVATFYITGPTATLLAHADIHDAVYEDMALFSEFAAFSNPKQQQQQQQQQQVDNKNITTQDQEDQTTMMQGICSYNMTVYPTADMEEGYNTTQPLWFAMVVLLVFFVTAVAFFMFDRLMTRQRDNIIQTAKKQNMIVSSLFPKSVQAKMMEQVDADQMKLSKVGKAGLRQYISNEEKGFGNNNNIGKHQHHNHHQAHSSTTGGGGIMMDKSKPIADLFPETTIMFGDIAGFTAWSSAREPSQVFILLETIYHEFDAIAKRRRVFKVEVVGDCYVAVCGLPDPRPDHAVVMAKFASECIDEMSRLTQELEVELGPDTTELALRVGLHSGPVVAGVLRGEKSRFQLFGDTMNTAARMESNGIPDRVQISQETADLLEVANKGHWFEARPDKIQAKGKGELTTYLLKIHGGGGSGGDATNKKKSGYESDAQSVASSLNGSNDHYHDDSRVAEKRNRIADWTVEVLTDLLLEIQVRREASQVKQEPTYKILQVEQESTYLGEKTVIDEVKEIIELPEFNVSAAEREARIDKNTVALSPDVIQELQDFVRTIACMYHDNPFHNFPHANHVTMSVVKLLSRIQAPDLEEVGKHTLHDHTYGITSDPLTRFAVVFSALIHDVDHLGVSNMQLVKENDPMAELYRNKSVAEQNSIDIAWDLLMEPRFDNLRRQIYTTEAEFKRFRQLVINTVLATDIMDKDLKELRNKRWATAFAVEGDKSTRQAVNRKATIVIEHLIQASDVAHTMQHWHIYRKWNERLFQEMYKAWEAGRLETDPSLGWYKGEIGFFDFYIIPLANKLKDCGVFGVSSAEYLSYATQNRKEWEARGEEIVDEMVRNVKRKKVANSVFMASRDLIDHEGTEIVAEMSRSLRRSSAIETTSSSELPKTNEGSGKPPQFSSVDAIHETMSATASNSSSRGLDRQKTEEEEEIMDSSVSQIEDSDYEEELEMMLQPM